MASNDTHHGHCCGDCARRAGCGDTVAIDDERRLPVLGTKPAATRDPTPSLDPEEPLDETADLTT